jgi:hypothetical protein
MIYRCFPFVEHPLLFPSISLLLEVSHRQELHRRSDVYDGLVFKTKTGEV